MEMMGFLLFRIQYTSLIIKTNLRRRSTHRGVYYVREKERQMR